MSEFSLPERVETAAPKLTHWAVTTGARQAAGRGLAELRGRTASAGMVDFGHSGDNRLLRGAKSVDVTTLRIRGDDAIRLLNEHRSRYRSTGLYPFLIGDAEDLGRIEESGGFNKQDPAVIVRTSFEVAPEDWIAQRRNEMEEYDVNPHDWLGKWHGELLDKGSMILHTDILTGKAKSEVFLGFAHIDEPWHLPAALKYGAWNDCPPPEVHCAFHRQWQERYGAEITGMSGDVVECTVSKPPTDPEAATVLAWQQYWYCADIVEQGVGDVSNLAATLFNSPYWYFWWD